MDLIPLLLCLTTTGCGEMGELCANIRQSHHQRGLRAGHLKLPNLGSAMRLICPAQTAASAGTALELPSPHAKGGPSDLIGAFLAPWADATSCDPQ